MKLKEIRLELNLTQDKMSKKLGVTQQQLSEWETGLRIPAISTIKKINKIIDQSFTPFDFGI